MYYDLNEVEYRVEHYLQNQPNGSEYTLKDTETPKAKYGASVTATPKLYDGYEYVAAKSTVTGSARTGLVLKLYYDLEEVEPTPTPPVEAKYQVRHYLEQLDGSYKEVEDDMQELSGIVDEDVTATPNKYDNYTYNAEKSTATGKVFEPEVVDDELNILTLKLYYDLNKAEYKVKHYLEQADGSYKEVTKDSQLLVAKIGAEVTATPNTYKNYTYNASKSTTTGTVFEPEVVDGELNILTLKLYYTLNKEKPTEPPAKPTEKPSEPNKPEQKVEQQPEIVKPARQQLATIPRTGNENHVETYFAMMALSLVGIVAIAIRKKNKVK